MANMLKSGSPKRKRWLVSRENKDVSDYMLKRARKEFTGYSLEEVVPAVSAGFQVNHTNFFLVSNFLLFHFFLFVPVLYSNKLQITYLKLLFYIELKKIKNMLIFLYYIMRYLID